MPTVSQAIELAQRRLLEGEPDAAAEICRRVVAAEPRAAAAWHLWGIALFRRGDLAAAREHFARAAELDPSVADHHHNLGECLRQRGELPEAEACYRRALAVAPRFAAAWNHLGVTLKRQGRLSEALDAFAAAVAGEPGYADAHANLGEALVRAGRPREAEAALAEALRLASDSPVALNNLAVLRMTQGRHDEAVELLDRALAAGPFAEGLVNRGVSLAKIARYDEALSALQQAAAANAALPEPYLALAAAYRELGWLAEASEALDQASRRGGPTPTIASEALALLNYDPLRTAAEVAAEHRRWGEPLAAALGGRFSFAPTDDPDRPLRIGYVSPDFRRHAVASFVEKILRHHSEAIEVYAYAEVPAPDDVTQRLQRLCAGWRTTCGRTDDEVAAEVYADRIDILVDLAGHTGGNRLGVFARKPAAVQATYLGYPNTTGLPTIDYRLTDGVTDPPNEPSPCVERLLRLPDVFCCYHPTADAPDVAPLPARAEGRITFGSPHGLLKINDAVLKLWRGLLDAVPRSRLLIVRSNLTDAARRRLDERLAAAGIRPERFELRRTGGHDYLAAFAEMDVMLDTFPYGGTTTLCEGLWQGVPLLTLYGDRHAARVGASLLTAIGLERWIARDRDELLFKAAELTRDFGRLAELRSGLRAQMAGSVLCDAELFILRLETAYRMMWRRRCGADDCSGGEKVP